MSTLLRSILFMVLILGAGCHALSRGPYATPTEDGRNPLKAQELNNKASELIHSHPEEAEKLLCEALTHDLYFGPGHNNLGVLHLKQGRLYEAANEFEWARKLMPGHPDPRMNLALTLERAGRIDDALATYESALDVYPNHLPTIQALARLQVRHDRVDNRTPEFLREIAFRSNDAAWTKWARQEMIGLDRH